MHTRTCGLWLADLVGWLNELSPLGGWHEVATAKLLFVFVVFVFLILHTESCHQHVYRSPFLKRMRPKQVVDSLPRSRGTHPILILILRDHFLAGAA